MNPYDQPDGGVGFLSLAMGVATWAVVQQTGEEPEAVYEQLLLNRPPGGDPITPKGVYEMMAATVRNLDEPRPSVPSRDG